MNEGDAVKYDVFCMVAARAYTDKKLVFEFYCEISDILGCATSPKYFPPFPIPDWVSAVFWLPNIIGPTDRDSCSSECVDNYLESSVADSYLSTSWTAAMILTSSQMIQNYRLKAQIWICNELWLIRSIGIFTVAQARLSKVLPPVVEAPFDNPL